MSDFQGLELGSDGGRGGCGHEGWAPGDSSTSLYVYVHVCRGKKSFSSVVPQASSTSMFETRSFIGLEFFA